MSREKFEVCFNIEKGKLIHCSICKILACKYCIPPDLGKRICVLCVRENIREELINENREKCKNLEQEITDLRDSAQHHQLEIESINDSLVKLENYMRASEISHLEKINNLQINLSKAKQNLIPYTFIDNLEKALDDMKNNEKINKIKYQQLCDCLENEGNEILSLKNLESMSEQRMIEIKANSANSVPYEEIRDFTCSNCLRKIKIKFKSQIIDGNTDSIIKSVMEVEKQQNEEKNENPRPKSLYSISSKKSIYNRHKRRSSTENCGCIVM